MQWRTTCALGALVLALAHPAQARVTRLEIESRTPAAGGYELLSGHVYGEVDPKAKRNAIIKDNAGNLIQFFGT